MVGTDKGLNLLNKQTNKFTRYHHNPKNINSLSGEEILSMLEDRQGAFWIATNGGLDMIEARTGLYKHYKNNPSDSNSLSTNQVSKIFEDSSGNLWIGSSIGGGINLLNKKTGEFKHYMRGSNVIEILQDSFGIIWVATEAGIYRRNNDTDDFFLFNDPASELGTANIVGIVEDTQNNLWIGSQSAIIKLNAYRNETSIYGRKYCVIPNSSYDLTGYKTRDGKLLFGDGTGYYAFFPRNLTVNAIPPQLQITDFKIGDISLKPGHATLTTPIELTQE